MNGEAIRLGLGLALAGLLANGCDGGEADPSIAKALDSKSEMEVAAAAMADKKREEAQAAKAAADAADAAATAEAPPHHPIQLPLRVGAGS